MVEKMKFLSITGPRETFDRVLDQYLSKYSIHLENALSELKNVTNLRPFTETNPYKDCLARLDAMLAMVEPEEHTEESAASAEELIAFVNEISAGIHELEEQRKALTVQRESMRQCADAIQPFRALEHHLTDILKFDFITFRFGRIAQQYFENFSDYLQKITDTLFYKCDSSQEYVYGVYFVPKTMQDRIDAVYASLHFEVISIQDQLPDHLRDSENPFAEVANTLQDLDLQLGEIHEKILEKVNAKKTELFQAKARLEELSSHFEVRKLAACTREDQTVYFILCGWMPEKEALALIKETENDEQIDVVFEDREADEFNPAPTRLKNPRIFKPFQMFIRMYGLPAQGELDPTVFVALTYAFIFGWMFGDVGQGAILVIGGFLLYKIKHIDLAAIIGFAGIFSVFFGFMFGSIFGFEDIIDAVWLRPISAMSSLPFVGRLNTVFAIAIAFGMGLNLLAMIFHIINGIRTKDKEYAFFDQNGAAGFVFYGALAVTVILFMTGHPVPAAILLVILFGIPLILIAFKEPITRAIEKKKPLIEDGKVMFVVQLFFEMFEILLSYFSNTLSFVRIGAFAVSHAAMMEVVLMLAGAESGSPNWVVVVLGNLFVCGLEGLIVGIQVLRLEYYELFSRFYKGTGREFVPYQHEVNKK